MKKLYFISLLICTLFFFSFSCSKDGGVNSSLSSGKGGSLARFAIAGNYLYALDGSDIVSYNISTGNAPVLGSRVKVDFDIETIYGYEGNLFIGAETGMYVYSLENPATPKKLSVVQHARSCDPVVVQGIYAYVTLRGGTNCGGTNVLNVYNISNLTAPVLLKSINMAAPHGLGVNGNALYVTNLSGFKIFDISQPDNPVFVKDVAEVTASDVIPYLSNNTLLVQLKQGTAFYDLSSGLDPAFLSRITQ